MFEYFSLMTFFSFISVFIYYMYLKHEKKSGILEDEMLSWLTKMYLILIYILLNLGIVEILCLIRY